MVNISKRMHKLMPKLLQVKGGPGAAVLPTNTTKPQLTQLTLRIPNPAKGADYESRVFWRQVLPALRYHNLALPIKVEQFKTQSSEQAPTLHLQFEATTEAALKEQKAKPEISDHEALIKWGDELRQRARKRDAKDASANNTNRTDSAIDRKRTQQEQVGIPKDSETTISAVTAKPQPPADPAAPSTTSPPVTIYQRSIQLGLRGRSAIDVWRYIQGLTDAEPQALEKSELREKKRQQRHQVQANQDRRRVKAGIDQMRKERDELKRAKEAAERLTAEA